MAAAEWLLGPGQRGNPATVLERRHQGTSWTEGNEVRSLVHGGTYFALLVEAVRRQDRGDLLLFADWRGDPDQQLDNTGTTVGGLLGEAAERGVVVRGLVWRSHMDRLQFSDRENRHLGEEIEAAGGVCLLDMRVRIGGSHHQKFVVLRHPGRPHLDVAFLGGIDLCHSRRDDGDHRGDRQCQPMAAVYGARPPWHDVQVAISGPAVGDVEATFRERWDDRAPLSRNPLHLLRDRLDHADRGRRHLPPQLPDPAPCGPAAVQILRTYPRRRPGYPFAPGGERSVARGVQRAVGRARALVYLEDQFLWSEAVVAGFCSALQARPELLLVAVLPLHPDQDGRLSGPPNHVGRDQAVRLLRLAGGDRVGIYGLENHAGTPVYVHAKVCLVDDAWGSVGSDNLNRRSWTYDSEISCAVTDAPALDHRPDERRPDEQRRSWALALRLELAREHLDGTEIDDHLSDPRRAFDAFARSAATLDAWYDGGRSGPRPPGRLRVLPATPPVERLPLWARLAYRHVYDPDGRSRSDRRADRY